MNRAIAAIGLAKQSAKGAPAANPDFWHGVSGGRMVDFSVDQKVDEVTTGLRGQTGFYREAVAVGADYGTRVFPRSIGAHFMAMLGNHQTASSGAPYVGTFDLGDSVPYYTLFSKLDDELRAAADCKLDVLKLAWEGTKPIEVNATWGGLTPSWPVSITAPSGAADETRSAYFYPVGGTFLAAVSGTSPSAMAVLGGSLEFKNNLTTEMESATVVPGEVTEGTLEVAIELKVRVADLSALRTILTSSPSGSTISELPVYGSFDLTFVSGTDSLQISGDKVPFTAETPEADPKGGPAEITLKGSVLIPAGETSPVDVTLTNGVADY